MNKLYEIYSGNELKVAELIQRRRLQMLIHSYLYYELNTNIIDDKTWDTWARELVELQKQYPELSNNVSYAETFKDWDASTGAFLKFDNWVKEKAMKLKTSLNVGKPAEASQPVKPKKVIKGQMSLF